MTETEPTTASNYRFVELTLKQLDYHNLSKQDKTPAKKATTKATGLWRVTITRLIRQHRETGSVRGRRVWKWRGRGERGQCHFSTPGDKPTIPRCWPCSSSTPNRRSLVDGGAH